MSAELESNQTFPYEYVKKLRDEAAGYRTDLRKAESALNFYINRYPLGDIENYSISRAMMAKAMSDGRLEGRAWNTYAPYEKAWIQAEAETKAKLGDQISGVDGAFLAPEDWNAKWFDLLRSKAVIRQLPVTVVNVPARVTHIPKVMLDVNVSYPGEGVAPTPTTFSFGQMTYTAHKAEAFINVSNELIRDAGPVADDVFRTSTAGAIATDRDTQLFVGQSTGGALSAYAPTGLINGPTGTNFTYYPNTSAIAGISQTPASFEPSYEHVAQLIAKIETLHGFTGVNVGQAEVNGIVAHPQFKQTLWGGAKFLTVTQQAPIWPWDLNANGGLFGCQWALSNAIPVTLTKGGGTSESVLIAGAWEQFVLFECLTLGYDSSPLSGSGTAGFAADQTQLRVVHRYDCGPAHPEAFGVLAGILV